MEGFLEIALSFPTILYTLLLTLVLVYWLFVIVGALDFDLLDSVFEGVGESLGEGAFEGASEAAGESLGEGLAEGVAEGAGEGAISGALSVVGALGLNKIPVTISLSLIILFAWPLTYFGARFARGLPYSGLVEVLIALAVLGVSSVAGVLLASLAARPLAGAFAYQTQSAGARLIGQTILIKSTRVDGAMGQGEFNDGGAGLLINVRCHATNTLRKGRPALIVHFDPLTEIYEVAPLDDDPELPQGQPLAARVKSQEIKSN